MVDIKNIVSRFRSKKNADITWIVDPAEGIDFVFTDSALEQAERGIFSNPLSSFRYAYLRGLEEQGYAAKNKDGYTIASGHVAELGIDLVELFELPPIFNGAFRAIIEGNTSKSLFSVSLNLKMSDGAELSSYSLSGPFLKVASDEFYSLDLAQWLALNAVQKHQVLPIESQSEYENNLLLMQLQLAQKEGMQLDLAHFNNLEIIQPEKVGIAIEELPNGDLALTPSFGSGITIADIKRRLGQFDRSDDPCILKVKSKFVLLDQSSVNATKELRKNAIIPKDQIDDFISSPGAFLGSEYFDLDAGFSFSPRVHGAERFVQGYFGDTEKSGVSWFNETNAVLPIGDVSHFVESKELLDELETEIENSNSNGADVIEFEGASFDCANSEEVEKTLEGLRIKFDGSTTCKSADENSTDESPSKKDSKVVISIDRNDEQEEFVTHGFASDTSAPEIEFTDANLKRTPYEHQTEGINWLLRHMLNAAKYEEGGGALLADDMGLGKTFMALVAIEEFYNHCDRINGEARPCLVVAPLSLLENWKAEVEETFEMSPFKDIVILQANADLAKFRVDGAGRETQQVLAGGDEQEVGRIRYSLKVGSVFGGSRLDVNRRLVLTTYAALRDYQFSLSRVEWSTVVFDEAQNIKNPNALASRAAKGLKASTKLLVTGTPVENSLKDFWSLIDTAVPGLLGAWKAFRADYIKPIIDASEEDKRTVKIDVGLRLRSKVGNFMLRRTKEGSLKGLPPKHMYYGDPALAGDGFLPSLSGVMNADQLEKYNDIIERVRSSKASDKRKLVLPSLLELKITSIHHEAKLAPEMTDSKIFLNHAMQSVKIESLIATLDEVKKRGEKVLIFITSKNIQAYVSALVSMVYKIPVDTINGDTQAIENDNGQITRKGIVARFESQQGFAAIVMSPIAAGTGLTIVGANNVIHLERHWNPAKEAQATDRVYRIGQSRDVNVYVPVALHPEIASFDLQLAKLLLNKTDLSDAVVTVDSVTEADFGDFF